MNSFFPDLITSWNIFIKHCNDISSFDILKEHINTFFHPKFKSIFGIHDLVGASVSRKQSHNFIDTPSYICQCNQGIEDTNNFLFSCPCFYEIHRATLVVRVFNITKKQPESFSKSSRILLVWTSIFKSD